jgi:hypothetical protein
MSRTETVGFAVLILLALVVIGGLFYFFLAPDHREKSGTD